jgi:LysR family transcriptional regulator for metE and metH
MERRAPLPLLEVRDLLIVTALAEAGSTVAAAPRLRLTQSAISRALLAAEERLGARLFERTPRGLSLTPAGERLVAGAGNLLAQFVALEAAARGSAMSVQLRIVCECYTAYRWLPSALAELKRSGANFDVTLAFEHSAAPVAALRAGHVDAALLTSGRTGGSIQEQPLFADEVVFLVAKDHPLARRAALTKGDLIAYPLIVSSATPAAEARWFLARVFGSGGQMPSFLRFPLTEAIVDATRAGMGVATMSEWIASTYAGEDGLVLKRLRGRPLERFWRMAYARQHGEAARRLADVLARVVPRLPRARASDTGM